MSDILLEIKGLRASIDDKEILKGVDLVIRKGEIHAIMGPNCQPCLPGGKTIPLQAGR